MNQTSMKLTYKQAGELNSIANELDVLANKFASRIDRASIIDMTVKDTISGTYRSIDDYCRRAGEILGGDAKSMLDESRKRVIECKAPAIQWWEEKDNTKKDALSQKVDAAMQCTAEELKGMSHFIRECLAKGM